MDVLFDNDVPGEPAVVQPVAKTALGRRSVWPRWAVDISGQVVSFAANDFAESTGMNAANHFDKGWTIADLKANVEAQFSFGALADVDDFFRAGHVDSHGLLEINVLGPSDSGLEVLRMKIRGRSDNDRVDFFGGGDFVKSVRANKELRRVDGAEALSPLYPVEVCASGVELIRKHIRERDDACSAGVDQIRGVLSAAPTTAKQAYANDGVGCGGAHQLRLDEHQPGRSSGCSDKLAAVEFIRGVSSLYCIVRHGVPPFAGTH